MLLQGSFAQWNTYFIKERMRLIHCILIFTDNLHDISCPVHCCVITHVFLYFYILNFGNYNKALNGYSPFRNELTYGTFITDLALQIMHYEYAQLPFQVMGSTTERKNEHLSFSDHYRSHTDWMNKLSDLTLWDAAGVTGYYFLQRYTPLKQNYLWIAFISSKGPQWLGHTNKNIKHPIIIF